MNPELLSSVVLPLVSGAVSAAFVSGLFTVLSKHIDFAGEYYKQVIDRRIAAYASLELLIQSIKVAVHDPLDKQLYHLLFAKDDDYQGVYRQLHELMSQSLWLSDATFKETRALNLLLFRNTSSATGSGLVAFGKAHYREIAEIGERLETHFAADLLNLHKVKSFLRSKRPARNFENIQSGG